jgi:hypothetical protein
MRAASAWSRARRTVPRPPAAALALRRVASAWLEVGAARRFVRSASGSRGQRCGRRGVPDRSAVAMQAGAVVVEAPPRRGEAWRGAVLRR